MSLRIIFEIPVDLVAHVLGTWLTLDQVSSLEVAMCSAQNRVNMEPVYEALIVENFALDGENMERHLDWLLTRKIRLCAFQIDYELQPSGGSFSKVAAVLRHSGDHLRSIDVENNGPLLNTIAATVLKHCTRVESLALGRLNLCATFYSVLSSLRHLKELTFCECEGIDVEPLHGLSCPNLTTLTLNCQWPWPVQNALLTMCTNLIKYSIFNADDVVLLALPLTIQSVAAHCCRFLRISNREVHFARITSITLYACDITDDIISCMVTSSSPLRELHLTSCSALTDAGLAILGERHGDSLRHLTIQRCNLVTSDGMRFILSRCKKLVHLSLGEAQQLDLACITAALENSPSLRILRLNQAIVSDAMLHQIATSPLDSLFMRGSTGYTEIGVVALMNGCTHLKKLVISNTFVNPVVKLLWEASRPGLQVTVV